MKEILLTSSVLILALLRCGGCSAAGSSRRAQYALWLLVLVRLLVPLSFIWRIAHNKIIYAKGCDSI